MINLKTYLFVLFLLTISSGLLVANSTETVQTLEHEGKIVLLQKSFDKKDQLKSPCGKFKRTTISLYIIDGDHHKRIILANDLYSSDKYKQSFQAEMIFDVENGNLIIKQPAFNTAKDACEVIDLEFNVGLDALTIINDENNKLGRS